jgi:hypothetical protein
MQREKQTTKEVREIDTIGLFADGRGQFHRFQKNAVFATKKWRDDFQPHLSTIFTK